MNSHTPHHFDWLDFIGFMLLIGVLYLLWIATTLDAQGQTNAPVEMMDVPMFATQAETNNAGDVVILAALPAVPGATGYAWFFNPGLSAWSQLTNTDQSISLMVGRSTAGQYYVAVSGDNAALGASGILEIDLSTNAPIVAAGGPPPLPPMKPYVPHTNALGVMIVPLPAPAPGSLATNCIRVNSANWNGPWLEVVWCSDDAGASWRHLATNMLPQTNSVIVDATARYNLERLYEITIEPAIKHP